MPQQPAGHAVEPQLQPRRPLPPALLVHYGSFRNLDEELHIRDQRMLLFGHGEHITLVMCMHAPDVVADTYEEVDDFEYFIFAAQCAILA